MFKSGISETQFFQRINSSLSPSEPIRSAEYLEGREKLLREIRQHLLMKGRHIFIHGDRGVGKTSLAQTAAIEFQSSAFDPVFTSCESSGGFESTLSQLVFKLFQIRKSLGGKVKVNLNLGIINAEYEKQLADGKAPRINSIGDAVELLAFSCSGLTSTPAIVIDEFDRILDHNEKMKFAELVKQITDREIDIKLIFTGIGTSLEELFGAHYSAGRAIAPIKLDRLDHESLMKIVTTSAAAMEVLVDRETAFRIAQLSDGYPYFVHLVCEMMYKAVFNDEEMTDQVALGHFDVGVQQAVEQSMVTLKEAYEQATLKYTDGYEHVLWAFVDKPTLSRQSNDIFNESYLPMMQTQLPNERQLTQQDFSNRLARLKTKSHGEIIKMHKRSWYEFRENMIRGYIRLRAKRAGVELGVDHH